MKLFCDHDFEIIDKTILPSAVEQTEKVWTIEKFEGTTILFRKKLVILLKCLKCKRLKEIVEINP